MKHIAYITSKPVRSGNTSVPDGAMNGNGDLNIILGSRGEGMRIHISKCDLWYGVESCKAGGLRPFGVIDIDIPAELYDNYNVEQDMDKGEIRCRFEAGNDVCSLTLRVCKTENCVMIESGGNVNINPRAFIPEWQDEGRKGTFEHGGCEGFYRIFDGEECAYVTEARALFKKLSDDKFCLWVATNHDTENPRGFVEKKCDSTDEAAFEKMKESHAEAWEEFWSKSSFETSDEELERGWYASQYLLGICTGNTKFPPGLYANFVTVEHPGWKSDYHLNYNYQAPFYAACSSNHVEFTDCYHTPLEEFEEKGRSFAQRMGCRGIIYPVGISPKGTCSELNTDLPWWFDRLFLGQKNNQIHPADIMIFRWKATRDKDYARDHAYPYVRNCLDFFEDYAVFEDGRFSVCRDAAHEVPYYKDDFREKDYRKVINDKNNVVTLGFLRLGLEAAIDMSRALGVDEDRREKWEYMLSHLSPFPTYLRFGKKVFRYTESGQAWNDGNDVGLQHIYPAGCVGLSSDDELLKTARTTFNMRDRICWTDDNAVCSYFPMAARLGIKPAKIIKKLRELNKKFLLPNMLCNFGGGCLETCPTFANTLNEMVLQSHQGILRIFPCWDTSLDVSFGNLRADGAFLVSASMKSGRTGDIKIVSEAGEKLALLNPFNLCTLTTNGEAKEYDTHTIILDTVPGQVIEITGKSGD